VIEGDVMILHNPFRGSIDFLRSLWEINHIPTKIAFAFAIPVWIGDLIAIVKLTINKNCMINKVFAGAIHGITQRCEL
jgi:hypothetical protein